MYTIFNIYICLQRLGEQGNQVDVIVSFERGGVSGHLNHVSTSIGAEMARNALKRNSFNSDNIDSEKKCAHEKATNRKRKNPVKVMVGAEE